MSPLVWLLLGTGLWIALAVPVALLTGRVFRGLDADHADHADGPSREPVGSDARR